LGPISGLGGKPAGGERHPQVVGTNIKPFFLAQLFFWKYFLSGLYSLVFDQLFNHF
jgi:hypothetical protein